LYLKLKKIVRINNHHNYFPLNDIFFFFFNSNQKLSRANVLKFMTVPKYVKLLDTHIDPDPEQKKKFGSGSLCKLEMVKNKLSNLMDMKTQMG